MRKGYEDFERDPLLAYYRKLETAVLERMLLSNKGLTPRALRLVRYEIQERKRASSTQDSSIGGNSAVEISDSTHNVSATVRAESDGVVDPANGNPDDPPGWVKRQPDLFRNNGQLVLFVSILVSLASCLMPWLTSGLRNIYCFDLLFGELPTETFHAVIIPIACVFLLYLLFSYLSADHFPKFLQLLISMVPLVYVVWFRYSEVAAKCNAGLAWGYYFLLLSAIGIVAGTLLDSRTGSRRGRLPTTA